MSTKYTKDRLTDLLLENQKVISDQVERNITAFNRIESTLKQINDNNRFHFKKDDDRDNTVKSLVASNNKFYKVMTYTLLIMVIALVVLAGAEKALEFIPNFL